MRGAPSGIEWPTLLILITTYGVWALATTALWTVSPVLSVVLTALAVTQHSSLQHEVLHGHPFASRRLNEALVFLPLGLLYPYQRFRDTHLAHHHDPNLTDPYDDPESNYQDPQVWARLPGWIRALLLANNTLLGRMVIGPVIGAFVFIRADIALIRRGRAEVTVAWVLHGVGLALLLSWLIWAGGMPVWAYVLSAYLANAILKIRTFLEHRAHEAARARTVIIEDKGPLALLFLNNNLHVVHHMHPNVPWYRLPALYAGNRDHYLRRNDSYLYRNYGQIFARYFLTAKDPVPHPVWPVDKGRPRD